MQQKDSLNRSIIEGIFSYLPAKRKSTPSGWISFNAPCCSHYGHNQDLRGRGGFRNTLTGGFVFNCFNCGFKTRWEPGRMFSPKTKMFLNYLGMPQETISKLSIACIKLLDVDIKKTSQVAQQNDLQKSTTKLKTLILSKLNEYNDQVPESIDLNQYLSVYDLPNQSKPISYWLKHPPDSRTEKIAFNNVYNYILTRNSNLIDWWGFYWSPEQQFKDRIIIPICNNKNTRYYGYTSRIVTANYNKEKTSKYLTSCQPGLLFNFDVIYHPFRKYLLVCEGVFDAISVAGVGVMKQTLSDQQIAAIKESNKIVIVMPDRDKNGKHLVEQAIDNGFFVSFPNWDAGLKDAADAVTEYGQLVAVKQIFESVETSPLKIQLAAKKWFHNV